MGQDQVSGGVSVLVPKRYDNFGKTGLNNWNISKSSKGETEPGVWKTKVTTQKF